MMMITGIREKIGGRIAVLVLCLLCLTLVSCGKTGSVVGEEIRFQFKSEGCLTKTAFGGVPYGARYERINWTMGDRIQIYCSNPEGGYASYSDYLVKSTWNEGIYGYGKIAPVGDGLHWDDHENLYNFFCVYPSPNTPGVSSYYVDFSIDHFGNVGRLSCRIPPKQYMEWDDTTSLPKIIGSPDMKLAYMFSATRTGYCDSVRLEFAVLFTAFQFRITTAPETKVLLDTFKLSTSTASDSRCLAGKFDTDLNPEAPYDDDFNVRIGQDGSSEIAVPLNNRMLAAGDTLDFTIFTVPMEIDNLTISLIGPEIGTRRLDLKRRNGNTISFPGRCKYLIDSVTFRPPTRSKSQVEQGTKSPNQSGSPVNPLEEGVVMRDGVICLNMSDEKYNHEWY